MLVDTHCHLNMIVKKTFDTPLSRQEVLAVKPIIEQAEAASVTQIINVGTSLVESYNSVELAKWYNPVYATVGIHPTDCTSEWRSDFAQIQKMVLEKGANKIVGIGEIGLDKYHKGYDAARQHDAFRAQIELALASDLAIVIHSRDAYEETLRVLEEYYKDKPRAVVHCFSYDLAFAQIVIEHGLLLGIGGAITYPKNETLRSVVKTVGLEHIVLETDAPFLPPQEIRGKENYPHSIKPIAQFVAELTQSSLETVAHTTTRNAHALFGLSHPTPPIFQA